MGSLFFRPVVEIPKSPSHSPSPPPQVSTPSRSFSSLDDKPSPEKTPLMKPPTPPKTKLIPLKRPWRSIGWNRGYNNGYKRQKLNFNLPWFGQKKGFKLFYTFYLWSSHTLFSQHDFLDMSLEKTFVSLFILTYIYILPLVYSIKY